MNSSANRNPAPWWVFATISACILAAVAYDCSGPRHDQPYSGATATVEAPEMATIPICATESDFDAMIRASSSSNVNAYRVPAGTEVSIVHRGLGKAQVRINSGDYAGRTGYIPPEWLKVFPR